MEDLKASENRRKSWHFAMVALENLRRKLEELSNEDQQRMSAIISNPSMIEVKELIRIRTLSREIFGSDLFFDPAWDMLLQLYESHLEQRKISISSVAYGAAVPGTTALRWLGKLEQQGLVERENDKLDGRRVWVRLSTLGVERMGRVFER